MERNVKTSQEFLQLIFILTAGAIFGIAGPGATEELDPLLRLLVAKGVITQQEATSLQAESEALEQIEASAPVADEPSPQTVAKSCPSWIDRFDAKGDIRLRYEGFSQDGSYDDDRRDRFRIRLRAGFEATVTDWMKVGLEMRNGDPSDPVSNNTSFDGGFQFKEFNLGQGFLEIRPNKRFGLIAGKFDAKKWWTVSDFQWDDDVTVEGLMTNFGLASGDGVFKSLDLVAYAFLLEEQKSGSDANLYGGQLRSAFRLGGDNSLKIGTGFDVWKNPQHVVDLTASGALKGNKITNLLDSDGQLISDFEILNLFAEYKNTSNKRWPLKFTLFYYRNLGAEGIGADNDTGYFGRIQVGDYKKRGQLALRYSFYYSEPDALFYVFTNSDTSRGSDGESHRFDLRLGFIAKTYFNFTWYNTKPVYQEDETINRWQLDYIVKF
ncbi:MAG: putative porin [Acidobacteria bacterium]|nr:putative porin [Acidobacteriota bacterium]